MIKSILLKKINTYPNDEIHSFGLDTDAQFFETQLRVRIQTRRLGNGPNEPLTQLSVHILKKLKEYKWITAYCK